LAETFVANAKHSYAIVHELASDKEVPSAIAAILAGANARMRLHLPEGSNLLSLNWSAAPLLEIAMTPPSGEDSSASEADCAIAETGTVAFLSGKARPSSWHFLSGREIVLVRRSQLVGTLEEMFAKLDAMPATLNLVTGPSRTGDIEQTMERGAHGPREIHILLLP
jgi:L-lactate dehydrogenase complex protein LldG